MSVSSNKSIENMLFIFNVFAKVKYTQRKLVLGFSICQTV
jgi:hypothetical protein